jgi:hypothetical protein
MTPRKQRSVYGDAAAGAHSHFPWRSWDRFPWSDNPHSAWPPNAHCSITCRAGCPKWTTGSGSFRSGATHLARNGQRLRNRMKGRPENAGPPHLDALGLGRTQTERQSADNGK